MKILTINPGDTIRVVKPEYKGKSFRALSTFYDMVEIEIGIFIELNFVQKKYRNRYININQLGI